MNGSIPTIRCVTIEAVPQCETKLYTLGTNRCGLFQPVIRHGSIQIQCFYEKRRLFMAYTVTDLINAVIKNKNQIS